MQLQNISPHSTVKGNNSQSLWMLLFYNENTRFSIIYFILGWRCDAAWPKISCCWLLTDIRKVKCVTFICIHSTHLSCCCWACIKVRGVKTSNMNCTKLSPCLFFVLLWTTIKDLNTRLWVNVKLERKIQREYSQRKDVLYSFEKWTIRIWNIQNKTFLTPHHHSLSNTIKRRHTSNNSPPNCTPASTRLLSTQNSQSDRDY